MHFAKRNLLVCHFKRLLSALLKHLDAHVDAMAAQWLLPMKFGVVWRPVANCLIRCYRIETFVQNFSLVVWISRGRQVLIRIVTQQLIVYRSNIQV